MQDTAQFERVAFLVEWKPDGRSSHRCDGMHAIAVTFPWSSPGVNHVGPETTSGSTAVETGTSSYSELRNERTAALALWKRPCERKDNIPQPRGRQLECTTTTRKLKYRGILKLSPLVQSQSFVPGTLVH